jgi:hypothetical protein
LVTVEGDSLAFPVPGRGKAAFQKGGHQLGMLGIDALAGLRRVLEEVARDVEPVESSPSALRRSGTGWSTSACCSCAPGARGPR